MAEERLEERDVAEVRQQCPVAGEEELLGVLGAEVPGAHLALEERDGSREERLEHRAELDAEPPAPLQGLPPHQPDELRVLHEEVEAGREHAVYHRPAFARTLRGPLDLGVPVDERDFEDLAVQRFLRREVVEEAGSADADRRCDVVERRALVTVLGEATEGLGQDGISG